MNAKIFSALVLVAVSISGCTIMRTCNSDGGMEIMLDENGNQDVRIDDICFREGLAVEQRSLKRNAGGILCATIVVRNTLIDVDDYNQRYPFYMQYKVTWFDVGGMAVLPDSSLWVQEKLSGGESKALELVAPTKDATRFVLRMKHVR